MWIGDSGHSFILKIHKKKGQCQLINHPKFKHYKFSICGFEKNGVAHIYLLGSMHTFRMLHALGSFTHRLTCTSKLDLVLKMLIYEALTKLI